jgi:hypothetical protein
MQQDLSRLRIDNLVSAQWSAAAISAISRRALNGRLQNFIKQLQPSAQSNFAPPPAPTPTLPDFQVVAVRPVQPQIDPETNQVVLPLEEGLTALYDLAVTNLGTKPQSSVGLSIQVTGPLEYVLMAQTPDSWN